MLTNNRVVDSPLAEHLRRLTSMQAACPLSYRSIVYHFSLLPPAVVVVVVAWRQRRSQLQQQYAAGDASIFLGACTYIPTLTSVRASVRLASGFYLRRRRLQWRRRASPAVLRLGYVIRLTARHRQRPSVERHMRASKLHFT